MRLQLCEEGFRAASNTMKEETRSEKTEEIIWI